MLWRICSDSKLMRQYTNRYFWLDFSTKISNFPLTLLE